MGIMSNAGAVSARSRDAGSGNTPSNDNHLGDSWLKKHAREVLRLIVNDPSIWKKRGGSYVICLIENGKINSDGIRKFFETHNAGTKELYNMVHDIFANDTDNFGDGITIECVL